MAARTGSTPDGRETPASMPTPPVAPMLAKLGRELPPAGDVVFEPKWDGLLDLRPYCDPGSCTYRQFPRR